MATVDAQYSPSGRVTHELIFHRRTGRRSLRLPGEFQVSSVVGRNQCDEQWCASTIDFSHNVSLMCQVLIATNLGLSIQVRDTHPRQVNLRWTEEIESLRRSKDIFFPIVHLSIIKALLTSSEMVSNKSTLLWYYYCSHLFPCRPHMCIS